MERSLLDTDTFSEILRGRDAGICDKADAYFSVFCRYTFSVTTITEQNFEPLCEAIADVVKSCSHRGLRQQC
jgi:hypothetical protein